MLFQRIKNYLNTYSVLIIFFVSLGIFSNTLSHGFVYDDFYIINRSELQTFMHLPKVFFEPLIPTNPTLGAYRPLLILVINLAFVLFGKSPFILHSVNITLHAICSVLVYYFAFNLGVKKQTAFVAGVIFAIHPVHVDVVANIKSADELLFGIFALLMLICMFRIGESKSFNYIFYSAAAFFCALLSKEMAVVLPVLAIILFIFKKSNYSKLVILCVMYGVALLAYTVLRYLALNSAFFGTYEITSAINLLTTATFPTRLFTGLFIYFRYMLILFMPVWLRSNYGYAEIIPILTPTQTFVWILGVFVLLVYLVLLFVSYRKKMYTLVVLIVCLHLAYIPFSQIFVSQADIMAERWLYVPSVFFCILFPLLFQKLFKNKYIYISFFTVLVIFFGIRTFVRNHSWANNIIFFQRMVMDSPNNVFANTSLGAEYLKLQKIEEAKHYANQAFKIYPDHPDLQNLLGNIAVVEKRYNDAEKHYSQSLAIHPGYLKTYSLLGSLFYAKEEYLLAKRQFEYILERGFLEYEDVISYAATLAKLKEYTRSLAILQVLSSDMQARPETLYLIGVNLYKLQKSQEFSHLMLKYPFLKNEEIQKKFAEF